MGYRIFLQKGRIPIGTTIPAGLLAEASRGTTPGIASRVSAYSNAARPDPSSVASGTVIFNSDDNAPNWSDGVTWRNSAGVST